MYMRKYEGQCDNVQRIDPERLALEIDSWDVWKCSGALPYRYRRMSRPVNLTFGAARRSLFQMVREFPSSCTSSASRLTTATSSGSYSSYEPRLVHDPPAYVNKASCPRATPNSGAFSLRLYSGEGMPSQSSVTMCWKRRIFVGIYIYFRKFQKKIGESR